ncbi:hypothetical protein B7463_g6471, partial [Scytalidium lignicola]
MESSTGEKPVGDLEMAHTNSSPNETKNEFPTGKKLFLILLSNALAMFLVALDRTIIATAVPHISDQFHSLNDIGWYASSYLITSCATQLIWGRIYTFYNVKYVYLAAVGLFEVGSVVCGAAPSSDTFIVGRAIAGLGSSGIFSGSMILITHVVPLHKRPMFVGMIGSIFGISSIIAPLLGGAFTDKVTWRWCFYINIPIGVVAGIVLAIFLRLPSPTTSASISKQITRLDPFGTLVFLPGIVCLLLTLQWGGSTYPWNDGRIIALFVVAGILLIIFVCIQIWRQEDATVPPRIIIQRSIACSALYSFFLGGTMISLIYFLPLWFQAIKGATPLHSGIDNLPLVLSLVVATIIVGAVITNTGYYNPWMFACSTFMSIGAGLITTFKTDTSSAKWIGYQVIFGLGLGMGMQQAGLAAQAVLSKKDVSTGVSIMFFAQSLGGALFICIGQAVFSNNLTQSLGKISGIDTEIILKAGATGLRHIVPGVLLPMVLSSYNTALSKAFIVALAAACFSIVSAIGVEWKNVKGLEHGGPSPENVPETPTEVV